MKKLTLRSFVLVNVALALFLANLLVFGPALRMGSAFTAGVAAGVAAGWAIFAIAGAVALKRGGHGFDERREAAFLKAAALSFWILLLASSLGAILLRSEALSIRLEARELAALMGNLGLVCFGVSWFVIDRRS